MRLEGKGSVYFSKPRLLSLSFSVRWLSLPRSPCFPRLSHPQSSNGEDVHGDNSAAFGRPRVVQVFKAIAPLKPDYVYFLKPGNQRSPVTVAPLPAPPILRFHPALSPPPSFLLPPSCLFHQLQSVVQPWEC